jgi:hypothetical protein
MTTNEVFAMPQRTTEMLAQFCLEQRNAFDSGDWYAQLQTDGRSVALAASYLMMTCWYGHQRELAPIASCARLCPGSSSTLYREAQAIGFDLPRFSSMVRHGTTGN